MDSERNTEFLTCFICESDAIESIADDPELVRRQIARRAPRGHAGALLLLDERASRRESLTQTVVKQTQSLIVAEQHRKGEQRIPERYRGNWRDCDVWIGGRKGASPAYLSSLMLEWTEKTVRWQTRCGKLAPVENTDSIARLHFEYEHIHPFVDGNGRSGRALVYYMYRFAGLVPFVFTASDRSGTYYPCFRDPERMIAYFRERTVLAVKIER